MAACDSGSAISRIVEQHIRAGDSVLWAPLAKEASKYISERVSG